MDAPIDRRLLERVERADREQKAREYARALREATPFLLDYAAAADESWFELDADVQEAMVAIRARILDRVRNAPAPRGVLGRINRTLYGLRLTIYERDVMRFAMAAGVLVSAVGAALARERAAAAHALADLEAHPDRAVTGEGETEEFDPGELLRRTG